MSMIFKFRVLTDEDENFLRDYEVPYDITLKELHEFVCTDLDYDEFEVSSFFKSDKSWQKLQEYTSMDMGIEPNSEDPYSPIPMQEAILGQIIHEKHERLLFVFDQIEDRVLFFELMEAKKQEAGMEYPRVLMSHGTPPDQFDASKNIANQSIFDEAMGEFGDFDGADYSEYNDE